MAHETPKKIVEDNIDRIFGIAGKEEQEAFIKNLIERSFQAGYKTGWDDCSDHACGCIDIIDYEAMDR